MEDRLSSLAAAIAVHALLVDVTIVIATRNRSSIFRETLRQLRSSSAAPILVLDNASSDDTLEMIRGEYPDVEVIALAKNIGAAARTIGVARAATQYVALCDDDCWWAPGAIASAVETLAAHPSIAIANVRILVGPDEHVDSVSLAMADGPILYENPRRARAIEAFIACAAVCRRDAFLGEGGFHPRYVIGAEEALLSIDLLEAGWELVYLNDAVAYHAPAPSGRGAPNERHTLVLRNRLWTVWLRYPLHDVWNVTARVARAAFDDPVVRCALQEALRGIFWVVRERRPMSRSTRQRVGWLHAPVAVE